MLTRQRGLGAVVDPSTGNFSYPGYCSWLPFSEFTDSCRPATPEQVAALGRRSLDKVRMVNPQLADQGERDQAAAIAADRRAHPQDSAEWDAITAHPTAAAIFGASGARAYGAAEDMAGPVGGLVNLGVIALLGVSVVVMLRGRS